MSTRTSTTILLVLVGGIIAGLAASPGVHIRYHLWRIDSLSGGNVNSSKFNSRIESEYTYHCKCLVKLGYFFHDSYELKYLEGVEYAHPALFSMIKGLPRIEGYATQAADGGPLIVYDLAAHQDDWESFVASVDRPNFQQKHAKLLDRYRKESESITAK